MKPVEPVFTVDLFPELGTQLLTLLRSLPLEDWEKPTSCAPWTVRDLVAHLLDGNIRRLSFQRDRLPPLQAEEDVTTFAGLVSYLNRLNSEWSRAARRISPALLIDLLSLTDQQLYQFFKTLPDHEPAMYPVAWAGDEVSPNWFDIAREFTEKWIHQQHIREALDAPALTSRKWLYPVLDICLRALPYTYRSHVAQDGTLLSFSITGEAGGDWSLLRQEGMWRLNTGKSDEAVSTVSLNQDTAWRLFSKGLSEEAARRQVRIEGDPILGAGIFQLVSIMA